MEKEQFMNLISDKVAVMMARSTCLVDVEKKSNKGDGERTSR